MTFCKQLCHLHKQKQNVAFKLCGLGLLKKASLKMCQTKIDGACWQEQEQAVVNFRECRERSRLCIFSSVHAEGDGPQLQCLCLKITFISERGWEGERCEETERMRKTGEWERDTAALLSTALAFVLVLLSLWQVWTAPYQTLPISGDATQPDN